MKKLLVFVLMLSPVLLNAQTTEVIATGRLINRIDQQSASFITHETRIETAVSQNKSSFLHGNPKSFKFTLQDSVVTGPQGGAPELAGFISNATKQQINVIFERTHLRIDSNLASSICLCSCYSDLLDTLPATSACSLDVGIPSWNFLFHPHTNNAILQTDTISDYIKLTALSGDPSDTISFIVEGILTPVDGVQDQKTQSLSNPRITAIYPSPLVQGSAIKVKVSSPRESNLSYSIYDGIGRVVALGVTRQHIVLGDNTISIGSLDGLGNGSYMLKFNFTDGTSDTHFFQVIR